MYSTGSSAQCSDGLQEWMGRRQEEGSGGGDICTRRADRLVHQRPTQRCKAIILQLKKKDIPRQVAVGIGPASQ